MLKNSNDNLNTSIELIKSLYDLYKDNNYITNKLLNTINNIPIVLENAKKSQEDRINKKKELLSQQEIFINSFLIKNQYFYLHHNQCYYSYDKLDYYYVRKDDILYDLLNLDNNNEYELSTNYKTQCNIIKKIKNYSLFQTIPESKTIQKILSLLSILFTSKDEIKYFLTILGDNILNKKNNLHYFISNKINEFILEINKLVYNSVNISNVMGSFKIKYREEDLNNVRLINIKIIDKNIWKEILEKNILNIICVSCYHSNRFENSEIFLSNIKSKKIKNNILFYKDNNIEVLFNDFCNKSIYVDENNIVPLDYITFNWKLYIENNSTINLISYSEFKNILYKNYTLDSSNNLLNINCKNYNNVYSFINFWKDNIEEDDNDELEIGEILYLYKSQNNEDIDENFILKIIKHFQLHKDILEDNKYLQNIKIKLWNKKESIQQYMNMFKDNDLTIHEMYNNYCKTCKGDKNLIVSKQYFEKIIYHKS